MDLVILFNRLLIPIIATIGVVVISLYIISYLNRFFHYLKMKDSIFLGEECVKILEMIFLYSFFSFLLVFLIHLYSHIGFNIRDYTERIVFPYFYTFFVIILVILFSLFFLSMNKRIFKYLRGELRTKPKKTISEKVGYYSELIIKYFIYFLVLFFSIAILLSGFGILGNTAEKITKFLMDNIEGLLLIFFIIVAGIIFYLIFVAFIKDIKLRSKSQKEKLGKYLTSILRNSIIVLVLLGIILIFLSMLGLKYADIFVFIFFIIIIIITVLFVFYTPMRNAISGILILSIEPFMEEDYINIEGEIEGTVVNINLFFTEIKDSTGKIHLVPNSKIFDRVIKIISSPGKNFPIKIDVNVPSSISTNEFEELVLKIIEDIPYVDKNEKPLIYLKEIGKDFDKYEIHLNAETSEFTEQIKSDILKRLKSAMDKH